jgi:hypothetical protein
MVESASTEQLSEMLREAEALGASADRTVVLYRREVDPKTGRTALSWWVEPSQTRQTDQRGVGARSADAG